MFQNIIIKISGEALKGKTDDLYNDKVIKNIIAQLKILQKGNVKVSLVIGGGNIWRGRDTDDIPKGVAHNMGMLASIMNGLYMAEKLKLSAIHARVFTPFLCGGMTTLYQREEVLFCLENNIIPIFSAGTGLPFFSTDTICAVRAADLEADGVIFTKEYSQKDGDGNMYSGMYTKDPIVYSDAKKIDEITYQEVLQKQLKAIDQAAISILLEEGIPSTIINIEVDNALVVGANPKKEDFFIHGTFIS